MLYWNYPMRSFGVSLSVIILFVLTACQPAATPAPACNPSSTTIDATSGYPEIETAASKGTLWGLLFVQDGAFHAGAKSRILWKMTDGRGDIKLMAIHEDGTQIRPVWGPISRMWRSDWKHPGQEWGTEFIFPKAGCWRIPISRYLLETDERLTGEIAIEVKP